MEFNDNAMPPFEVLQQMSECCEEIEDAVRFGIGSRESGAVDEGFWERFSIEPYVERFDEEYRSLVREEFSELVRELRVAKELRRGLSGEGVGSGGELDEGSRYEVLEMLAEGGMGRVSIAWDREFSRRVAIKSIQPQVLTTQEVRARFDQEAQVTAKLEHPGILPVYSRGESAEEGPYYTMRLIAGGNASSLHRAIRELHDKKWVEKDFSRRQRVLLRHVINVCNTIGYAHDRGVCHRDLKPSNILIGPFGETFVVDWGLAKVFREGKKGSGSPSDVEDSTAMGSLQNVLDLGLSGATRESVGSKSSVAGTPGYRAPESLGNEMVMDWPMVDVYSVGAILHCIIYGKSPSKSQDVRASALQDDSFFLRLVMQRGKTLVVSSKLLAISEKAMHCDLKQRYKSTLALANDLENYLSGEPISAKGEGIVERGVRWIGKHRHWALAGLAAAITLAGAAVTVVVLQSQHNRELQMAANTLQRAFESEELHRVQEGRLRELAERNERAARDREGLAIEALRSYCEAIYRNDVLKNSASLIGLRQQLLEDPIAFFEEISKGNTDVNDTSFSYLERLAQTAEELAKLSFEYGDYAQCERWVARSIERYEDLERKLREDDLASGKSSGVRTGDLLRNTVGHSDSYRMQGMIRILRGDRVGAKESLQTAMRLFNSSEEIERDLTDDKHSNERLGWFDKRAELYALLAIFEAEGGDLAKVMPYFEVAMDSKEKVVQLIREGKAGSDDRRTIRERAAIRSVLDLKQDRAHVFLVRGLGNRDESMKQFQSYIEKLRESLSGVGANESDRLRLAWALHNMGGHHRQDGSIVDASRCYEESLQLRRELVAGYPSVVRYRADLSRTLAELAHVQVQLGRKSDGHLSMRQSLEGLRRLGQDVPGSNYELEAIRQLHQWGHVCIDTEMKEEGESAFTDALREFEEALEAEKASVNFDINPGLRLFYLELLEHQAEIFRARSDYMQELELRRRMRRVAEESNLEEVQGELWRLQLGIASAAVNSETSNAGVVSVTTMVHRREVLEVLRDCSKELVKRREALGAGSSAWQMIRDEVQQRFFGSTIFETYRSKQFLEQLEAEERSEWESLWNMLRVVD